MLIIKIKREEQIKEKKRILKRKKLGENNFIERVNFKVGNDVHTLVNLPVSCWENEEILRLLKIYKGRIIVPDNIALEEKIKDYLFDIKPYCKRAILSAFIKYMGNDFNIYKTVCIADSSFQITQEYADVAKFARNLVILTENNIKTQSFTDYCYLNLGTVVSIKDKIKSSGWDIYLNLDDTFDDGRATVKFRDKEAILHPDPDYFICNKEISEIISYGVPVKTACAAFEAKKQEEINWAFKSNKVKSINFNFT